MKTMHTDLKTPNDSRHADPIQITVVDSLDTLQPWRERWNDLVLQNPANTVFQTFEWHVSWWKAFGSSAEMLILLAEVGETLVGIAPLMISRKRVLGWKRRVLEFIGTRSSDYCDFIIEPDSPQVLRHLWQWLVEHRPGWDIMYLSNIREPSHTLHMLPDFFDQHRCPTISRFMIEAPTRLFGNHEADQKLVKKKSLKRHQNYFRQRGALEFKRVECVDTINHYLDSFFQQHIDRWGETETPSMFLDVRQQHFYREMVRELAPTGWLFFSVVLFDEEPLAFHLGFDYNQHIIWYKPTFNTAYARNSPGEVLIKYLLEYALEHNAVEFDFTVGEESFKYRFANHVRSVFTLRVFGQPGLYDLYQFLFGIEVLVKRSYGLNRLVCTLLKSDLLKRWLNLRWR
jgi:CelD/BcsL family acetyltransferase involved in cellulose biosynthesis